MTISPGRRASAPVCLIAFGALLGACSVSSPLAVTSNGSGLDRGSAVALGEADPRQELRSQFRTALVDAFDTASSRLSDDAPVFAEFSIALTDASAGVVSGKGDAVEPGAQPDWLTAPRQKRNLDKCAAQRVRAAMVLYDRAGGDIIYRGWGEAVECDFSDAEIAAIAQALVDDAIAQSQR